MWILTALQSGGESHYLLQSKDYVVGRKNCDIILPSDQSISRAHAHLTATDQTLTVKDTSKYGTFVNDQRLTENTPVSLNLGDNLTFGVFHSKFVVDHQKPVVCSSCLDNNGKASLSQSLSALGGKLVNSWTQDCTHLAMPTAKVTVKTICALLCCRPIVKPEFFSELSRAAQQKLTPPKADGFTPEIDEPSLNKEDVNLGAIPGRKRLFAGKTFIFLSAKQLKRLSAAVSFGGGRAQLLEDGRLPRELLESEQSCVIDATTSSSQPLLPPSSCEWAGSVRDVVQRKGLRLIPESEIGLAAIYASCEKYCNPSSSTPVSNSVQRINPRIPSASLSQSVAVDETVLPAASQNITAYAVNTEQSQRREPCEVTGVSAVGETPEKKRAGQVVGSKPVAQRTLTQCVVADTMRSSFNTVEDTLSKPTASGVGSSSQVSGPRSNGGVKTFPNRQSPQKPRTPVKVSPQKQSALTSFFQPVNKKRPLEDDSFSVISEPKRPILESSIGTHTPAASVPSAATTTSQNAPASVREEPPRSRKRKEAEEEEIQMDELESLMSEDFFDEPVPSSQSPQAHKPVGHSAPKQSRGSNAEEASSSSKRQRVGSGTDKAPQGKEPSFTKNYGEISIKTEPVHPPEYRTTTDHESNDKPRVPSAGTSENIQPFEEDNASFIDDAELLQGDIFQPKEEPKTPQKPVTVGQEVKESKVDDDLPQKLVLVEFRSLTVTAPPKTKPQRTQGAGDAKNYKCFRKIGVPGVEGSSPIIGGSGLLVHNKGKNSDLDEWLKDAAEEERQSKRDETVGDDLFRYNPSKLTKRR